MSWILSTWTDYNTHILHELLINRIFVQKNNRHAIRFLESILPVCWFSPKVQYSPYCGMLSPGSVAVIVSILLLNISGHVHKLDFLREAEKRIHLKNWPIPDCDRPSWGFNSRFEPFIKTSIQKTHWRSPFEYKTPLPMYFSLKRVLSFKNLKMGPLRGSY